MSNFKNQPMAICESALSMLNFPVDSLTADDIELLKKLKEFKQAKFQAFFASTWESVKNKPLKMALSAWREKAKRELELLRLQ